MPEGMHVGKRVKLHRVQKQIIRGIYGSPTRRAIVSFGRKNGKGLSLDTPIPTTDGWRTMGDLCPGDWVYDLDGEPARVLYVSPTHRGLRCWRVSFSDGSSVVADAQHQWVTRHRYRPWAKPRISGSGNGGKPRTEIVTTPQIAESVYVHRPDGKKEHNHKVEVAGPLHRAPIDLPLSPYVLGAWLGNGTTAQAVLTYGDDDVDFALEQMRAEGIPAKLRAESNPDKPPQIALTDGDCSAEARAACVQARLRKIGVLGNKHIPDAYLGAGTAQRWALLQGLMDTDGTVHRHGGRTTPRCSFTSTKETLARDTWRLCRSLGLKATLRERDAKLYGRIIGNAFEVSFTASRSDPVFRLDRKQRLLPGSIGKRSRTLAITACEEIESVPTRCIQVDSPSGMFLCGEGCIPTHNTTLVAMLVLLHLVGPEAKPNSQLYSTALSRDQASILFALAAKMVRMSPELVQFVTVRDTAKQLHCAEIGTLYRALSAEASTAFGLSPAFAVHDELGQVKGPRSDLYDAIETAAGAQESPLSVIISTQAPTDADLLSVLIDDAAEGQDPRTKLFLWTAPTDLDPFAEATWKLANPLYGVTLNPEEVKEQAARAERMPSAEASFRNLILNQRVNMVSALIPQAVWKACAAKPTAEVLDGRPVFAALDLSARSDLTALVWGAQADDGVWHVWGEFWTPSKGLFERSKRDRVPYDLWCEQGWITRSPGATVEYADVAERLLQIRDDYGLHACAFDRWRMDVLEKEIERLGVELARAPEGPMVPHGQGYRDMSPAIDMLEGALAGGKIRHGGNPVLTMCAANAIATTDPAGNRKLDKAKARGRIDGLVALAMMLGVSVTTTNSYGPSVYEERGILEI